MKLHTIFDPRTGQSMIRGRSGRMYTTAEYERARTGDDAEAAAMRADIDRTDFADVDVRQLMLQQLHDCPECRAAMAAGEQPQIVSGEELLEQLAAGGHDPFTKRRPRRSRGQRRWRDQRKVRG